ncbi:MAG: fatty acid desaturase [Bacteroidales bacterium]|nr:fatty acid desaturase [Bacteroidales bacterium]
MTKNFPDSSSQAWQAIVSKYNQPVLSKSVWQIINSVAPYLILWGLSAWVLQYSFWLALPLMVVAAGFLVRIFIIFHDCGHGSFFRSKKLNRTIGTICGILAFTPYDKWTDSHRNHHQTVGNLDKRGDGDVWTLTVEEYQNSSSKRRFFYRLFRHPVFLIFVAGPLSFLLYQRFTRRTMTRKQKKNIYFTNVVLLLIAVSMSLLIGWQTYLLVQFPIMAIAAMGGIYLFYFQHQYDDVIWRRNETWNYKDMALEGSSYFKLPALLRWFTGNIGFHHVHHLGPKIPNYNLVKCHNENPMFQEVKPFTLWESFHSLKLRLWDEKNNRIVTFRDLRRSMA